MLGLKLQARNEADFIASTTARTQFSFMISGVPVGCIHQRYTVIQQGSLVTREQHRALEESHNSPASHLLPVHKAEEHNDESSDHLGCVCWLGLPRKETISYGLHLYWAIHCSQGRMKGCQQRELMVSCQYHPHPT
jgi:hypothetical protein